MRAHEFVTEWTVSDNALIGMFEEFGAYLNEGADEKELQRLNQFLTDNQVVLNPVLGKEYYPVSINALLTTVDPSTPAFITISRFSDNRTLESTAGDSYVFSGLKFVDNGINGGFLKRTLLFDSEQQWQEMHVMFLLGFSGHDWKIREKIL